MSTAIFVIGVLVFLITVYGTVVAGGLLLTDRQLDEQPELVPDQNRPRTDANATVEHALELVRSEF
jgi:hypothetical protein